MSHQTSELLHLFGELSRIPRFIMALRLDFTLERLRNHQSRSGARGLLVELWKRDGLTNTEIAELLDIRPSSVTAQVKNLEERGLVVRVTDEKDRRVSRVFLTEKGKQDQAKRTERHGGISEDIFSVLSDEEQVQLATMLVKIIDGSKAPAQLTAAGKSEAVTCQHGVAGFTSDWKQSDGSSGPSKVMAAEPTYTLTPREMRQAANEFRKVQQDILKEFRRNFQRMWENGDFDQFRSWEDNFEELEDLDWSEK